MVAVLVLVVLFLETATTTTSPLLQIIHPPLEKPLPILWVVVVVVGVPAPRKEHPTEDLSAAHALRLRRHRGPQVQVVILPSTHPLTTPILCVDK